MLHAFAEASCRSIEFVSILIIIVSVAKALLDVIQLCFNSFKHSIRDKGDALLCIRISLESNLLLGLQFLMAADIIGTIRDPDVHGVIILSSIVLLRVVLSFTLNHEIASLAKLRRTEELSDLVTAAEAGGSDESGETDLK